MLNYKWNRIAKQTNMKLITITLPLVSWTGSTDHENNGGDTSTLLQLIVGYSDGIQCWVILVRAVTLKVGRCPLHRCTLLIYTGKVSACVCVCVFE